MTTRRYPYISSMPSLKRQTAPACLFTVHLHRAVLSIKEHTVYFRNVNNKCCCVGACTASRQFGQIIAEYSAMHCGDVRAMHLHRRIHHLGHHRWIQKRYNRWISNSAVTRLVVHEKHLSVHALSCTKMIIMMMGASSATVTGVKWESEWVKSNSLIHLAQHHQFFLLFYMLFVCCSGLMLPPPLTSSLLTLTHCAESDKNQLR